MGNCRNRDSQHQVVCFHFDFLFHVYDVLVIRPITVPESLSSLGIITCRRTRRN